MIEPFGPQEECWTTAAHQLVISSEMLGAGACFGSFWPLTA